ncbi:hypothetical protein NARC_60170 [Candidatus Nitrosocosmicus arcticus]|uniref:Uncharacterized protein n=2 Tax=Candidatus Nitrosocosmicus arcticus TaxID=2035267 RepID=A0A557SW14_9ARCH|nr:hypothetical protein NARC_60170 [Candidatus Nitrosocosmicus arcticus]
MYRIENGKIVEHQDIIEIMDMLREMGAIQFTNTSSLSTSLENSTAHLFQSHK